MLWKYCACHTKRLLTRLETCWNATKCHACHANEATRRWKPPKVAPFAELLIDTAIRTSREQHVRTVANGCGRLRTVADVNATSGEHCSTPTPPEWNGNPCYAFGKKIMSRIKKYFLNHKKERKKAGKKKERRKTERKKKDRETERKKKPRN